MRITLVIDANEPDQLARFWSEAMRYQVAEAFGQYRVLLPADGDPKGPALVLQGRAAGGADAAGKSRIHIDLHPKHPERHILTLQRMGARTVGARVEEFDTWWQVMADPEGNVFCVVAGPEGPDEGSASTA